MRHTITNLGDTQLLSKHTYALQPPTTGKEYTQTYSSIQKHVSPVNVVRDLLTNHLHCTHFQHQNSQTSASTPTFLDQCWQPDASTNTFYASWMLSLNTQSSHLWRTKKRKLWLKPFFPNGFVNSASQCKFTLMAGKSISNYTQMKIHVFINFGNLHHLIGLTVMLKIVG